MVLYAAISQFGSSKNKMYKRHMYEIIVKDTFISERASPSSEQIINYIDYSGLLCETSKEFTSYVSWLKTRLSKG